MDIVQKARELGFDHVGITPATPSSHTPTYATWASAGYAGEMSYLIREEALRKRAGVAELVPGARSVIVVAKSYSPSDCGGFEDISADRAIFARYARNEDYHDVLTPRLIELQNWISHELLPLKGRAYIDTGPVLERELAVRAGLGWAGKNTMLIQPQAGSYFFLGCIIVDVELEYDEPFARHHCGTCDSCLTGCPTGALLGLNEAGAPLMDARRCISYLTIELKGPIPRELRPLIGNRVYGCDICQEVCPHNSPKFIQITSEQAFLARQGVHGEELIKLMGLSQDEFSQLFRRSPVKRAKRRGLLRNVAVALGNWGSPAAVPALSAALADSEPLIRGHAAWALGRIGGWSAREALLSSAPVEQEAWVQEEIALALSARDTA